MRNLKQALTEYWFATITSAILIGTGLTSLLSTIGNNFSAFFDTPDDWMSNGDNSFEVYLYGQFVASLAGVILGIILLVIRSPKK